MITIYKEDIKDFKGLGMKIQFNLECLKEKTNFFMSINNDFYNDINEYHIEKENRFYELLNEIEDIDFDYYLTLKEKYLFGQRIPDNKSLIKMINSYYNWKN